MCLEVKKSAKRQEKNGNIGGRRKAGGRIAGIGHARFQSGLGDEYPAGNTRKGNGCGQ